MFSKSVKGEAQRNKYLIFHFQAYWGDGEMGIGWAMHTTQDKLYACVYSLLEDALIVTLHAIKF